jgi:hypothetical protein
MRSAGQRDRLDAGIADPTSSPAVGAADEAGRAEAAAASSAAAPAPGDAAAPAARVVVNAGVCGHTATVRAAKTAGYLVRLTIESDCPHVQKIAPEPIEVDALRQVATRAGLPSLLEDAYRSCAHAACPEPCGLVKAAEVATGLALPADVEIRITKEG